MGGIPDYLTCICKDPEIYHLCVDDIRHGLVNVQGWIPVEEKYAWYAHRAVYETMFKLVRLMAPGNASIIANGTNTVISGLERYIGIAKDTGREVLFLQVYATPEDILLNSRAREDCDENDFSEAGLDIHIKFMENHGETLDSLPELVGEFRKTLYERVEYSKIRTRSHRFELDLRKLRDKLDRTLLVLIAPQLAGKSFLVKELQRISNSG